MAGVNDVDENVQRLPITGVINGIERLFLLMSLYHAIGIIATRFSPVHPPHRTVSLILGWSNIVSRRDGPPLSLR